MELVIELDGAVHTTEENAEYDKGRTFELEELGVTVLRFWNDEVMDDIERVLTRIKHMANL